MNQHYTEFFAQFIPKKLVWRHDGSMIPIGKIDEESKVKCQNKTQL
jgi:hypothetical protein